jgi:hypothetical protein
MCSSHAWRERLQNGKACRIKHHQMLDEKGLLLECSCDRTDTARAPIPAEATATPFSSTHSSSSQSSWIVFTTSGISSLVLRCIPPNWCQIAAFYADCGYRKLSRWEVSRPELDLLASDAETDDIIEIVVSIISNKRRGFKLVLENTNRVQ